MIDANGAAGYNVSDSIGDYGDPQEKNRGGNHFHAYLRGRRLAAVNAICDADGPGYTYTYNGHPDRIDYIAVPIDSARAGTHSEVIDCIDMHETDEDHLPVLRTMKFRLNACSRTLRPLRDARKMICRQHQELFSSTLSSGTAYDVEDGAK